MLPQLEIRDLAVVQNIVQQGGVAKAAKALNISQSAISHHLSRVEDRLGLQLFERAGRSLQLTHVGTQVLKLAEEIIPRMHQAERRLLAPQVRTKIRLSTQCYTCYHWLSPLLDRFQAQHPGTDIEIALDSTRAPIEALKEDRLDLAVAHIMEPDRSMVKKCLFEDQLLLIMAKEHPLALKEEVKISELTGQTMFVYDIDGSSVKAIGQRIFQGRAPKMQLQKIPLTEAIVELVKSGRGVSLLTSWAIKPWLDRGEVTTRPLKGAKLTRKWYGTYCRSHPQRELLKDLVNEIVEVLKPGLGG